jgi:hypothetical protein
MMPTSGWFNGDSLRRRLCCLLLGLCVFWFSNSHAHGGPGGSMGSSWAGPGAGGGLPANGPSGNGSGHGSIGHGAGPSQPALMGQVFLIMQLWRAQRTRPFVARFPGTALLLTRC